MSYAVIEHDGRPYAEIIRAAPLWRRVSFSHQRDRRFSSRFADEVNFVERLTIIPRSNA